ncbi:MAG: single-stranded-DNA-specific exonuclease RecJ [Candidatus Pacearchaeota archaeon]|nr:MAG: single-stranded-DNA-specific exonuclease RecJ [Candidatus Pacearchaeota archaeon]
MPYIQKEWNIRQSREKHSQILIQKLGISPLIATLLTNRGIIDSKEAEKFLRCRFEDMHNPLLLKDMNKAINRIEKAITNKERIMLFGDYDVDGITASAILVKIIKLIGGKIIYYFPNRLIEGYGLNKKSIDYARRQGVGLIITVDCGISANKEIKYAKRKSIDVIVTDHHEQIGLLPKAVAIINPKQKKCNYPYKKLSGVGIAFKVAQVLIKKYNLSLNIISLLDLVCLGTIADIVPLDGENRIIVKYGLKQLMRTENIGLKALIKVSGLRGKEINSGHISFRLAPRINAAGRLTTADKSMELLQTNSENKAQEIAYILDEQNIRRQVIQEKILEKALLKIKKEINLDKENCIILAEERWHRGIIGIVASRIVEIYNKPTILISIEKDRAYGSGRSIPNFHLLKAVDSCKNLLINYGGHEQAIGIKINKRNIKKFRKQICKYAKNKISSKQFMPILKLDAKLDLADINPTLIKEINQLPPFGIGNPKPIFYSTNLSLTDYPNLLKEKHLKIKFYDNYNNIIEAIGFRMAHFLDKISKNTKQIHIAYLLELNEWKGNKTVRLNLKDIKFGDELNSKLKDIKTLELSGRIPKEDISKETRKRDGLFKRILNRFS